MTCSLSRLAVCVVAVLAVGVRPSAAWAGPFIDMGPAPLLGAYDQPFVELQISSGRTTFGPDPSRRHAILDTGSSSILVVGEAAADLSRSTGDFSQGEFLEQGIGGFTLYQVSAPYTVRVTGTSSTILRDNVRILSEPGNEFDPLGSFQAIVGMPALVNRVTTLDLTAGAGGLFGGLLDIDFSDLDQLIDAISGNASGIGVSFSDALPPSNGHRYGIATRALHFDPDQPEPTPTVAPLPVVTASHHLEGKSVRGDNYIFDTGAQLSFISLDKARALGLDPNDPFTTLPVSGVGGITDVPVFYVEELRLMSQQGVDLVWTDVQVLGLDLDPRIDGVIGSDLLTAGMVETDLEAIDLDDLVKIGEGPIRQVHFDFRGLEQPDKMGNGVIYLDLNPDFNVVQQRPAMLQAGDADEDLTFDQLDIVQVLQRAQYLSGRRATWGDGDWNGAPGGQPGNPPSGDGLFNQRDIVAALQHGLYNAGPYAAVRPAGHVNDGQTSLVYDSATGEIAVDAPAGTELTSINIDSAAGIFTGQVAENLGGSFDNDSDDNIFKATFGSSFGSLSFGRVAPPQLAESFLLGDLSVVGSLRGGGGLGDVDLVYLAIPEPASVVLAAFASFCLAGMRWKSRQACHRLAGRRE